MISLICGRFGANRRSLRGLKGLLLGQVIYTRRGQRILGWPSPIEKATSGTGNRRLDLDLDLDLDFGPVPGSGIGSGHGP